MKKIFVLICCICLTGQIIYAGGSSQKAGGPSSDGPVEFSATFIKGAYHGDPNDMVLYKQIEKDTNTKVNWMIIPEQNRSERKNILINSGDMPDVFYMEVYTNDEIDRYGRQGLFLDLTNPIKQHAPNIQRIIDTYPSFKALQTNPGDGKIYQVSGMLNREADGIVGQMFLYQPWLDKLGLKMPTTYLEFEHVLREFKTKDPNGNGRADEFPFVFANGWSRNSSLQNLFAMFGYAYEGIRPGGDSFVQTSDNKAIFVPATENYKEAIIWFNKLFSEGLLAEEDYAAMDRNLFSAKNFSDPVVTGGFVAFHKNSAYVPAERFDDYTRISIPMKGPHGHQIYPQYSKVFGYTRGFVITQKGANKVPALMRWIDAHFEPRRSIEVCLGPIGVTLDERPDGMITYKPTPPDTNYNQFRYGQCPVWGPFFIPPDWWGTKIEIMEEDVDRLPWVKGELAPYMTQWFIYSYPIVEETEFIQTKGKEIEDYVKNTQARWLMQGGIEREWDAFQARLKTMGVDEYTRVMQNQVDRLIQYSK